MKLSVRGLTLSELMITMAILIIAISGLLLTFIYCLLLNESNNNLVTAMTDAQYVLEGLKGTAYSELGNYTAPAIANLRNENITITLSPDATNMRSEAEVTVGWNERGRQRNVTLSTNIARTQ